MSMDYYSDIPEKILIGKRILDVGSGTGKNQLISRHCNIFLDASQNGLYLGVEKELRGIPWLFTIQEDIRNIVPYKNSFDTILLMHSLEHIPIVHWAGLFNKLKKILTPNGWIVIACPFDENILFKRDSEHVVSNITLNTLEEYLPNVQIFRANVKYPKRGNLKSAVWWFRQFMSGVRYVPLGLTRYSFIAFWQNDEKEN